MKDEATAIIGYGHIPTQEEKARWKARHMQAVQQAFICGMAFREQGEAKKSLFWLGRAERLAGVDANITFSYAMVALAEGMYELARPRLRMLWEDHHVREAGFALAGCLFRCDMREDAAHIMGQVLSRNAIANDCYGLADALSFSLGYPGWASLSNKGTLRVRVAGQAALILDDILLGDVPAGVHDIAALCAHKADVWSKGERLEVVCNGRPVLGSPFNVQAITRFRSLVVPEAQGVRGWLWYPGEPDFTPKLTISGQAEPLLLEAPAQEVTSTALLQQPRGFFFSYKALPQLKREVVGFYEEHGRLLLGAPLHPELVALRRQAGHFTAPIMLEDAQQHSTVPVVKGEESHKGCAIVIPVYQGMEIVQRCLESVLATVPVGTKIIVVDDASVDRSLKAYLAHLAATGHISLRHHEENKGFIASINTGLENVPAGWDVILLNSDTIVFSGWVERLCRWLRYKAVGTATAFSNAGGLTSYPKKSITNPTPERHEAEALDQLFQACFSSMRQERALETALVHLPTANGFCMAVTAECLAATGPFRREFFAQGYAEENDFCLRARQKGFVHVAALDVYIMHDNNGSFGEAGSPLLQRNLEILNQLYPGYDEQIQRWQQADPLHAWRRFIDIKRLQDIRRDCRGAVLLLQHRSGGGVARAVRERAEMLVQQGIMPLILEPTGRGCRLASPIMGLILPNIGFTLPDEWPYFIEFLKELKVQLVEWHHLLGHAPLMRELHHQLDVPYDVYIHDHIWFCPQIALLDEHGRYCGEPDEQACNRCVATRGDVTGEGLSIPALLLRSTHELGAARRVVAPSQDTARRLRRHIPSIKHIEIMPLEDDRALQMGLLPSRLRHGQAVHKEGRQREGALRVVLLGGISHWKGYEVVLELGRHIQRNAMPIELILVGSTHDDGAYAEAGIDVTGPYKESEVLSLLAQVKADIGFVPSIAPETWCYTLGWLWKARLDVVCFDIGAAAERIKCAGPEWGRVLPLGMPVEALAEYFARLRVSL